MREDRLPTVADLAWLCSPQGREICAAMATDDPADTPAAIARWRQRLEPEKVSAAWAQVLLRRSAATKFSRAEEMLFDRVGLEQATDEIVAHHKARRFAGFDQVVDLCCGIGGDVIALAGVASVVAVDWSNVRLSMAAHNAEVYDRRIATLEGDAAFVRPDADAVHVDPDRRATGRRRHAAESGSPDLSELERIVRHYEHAALKLSPGIDFASLPFDGEIELISHRGECKQAVIWTGKLRTACRRATLLPEAETIVADTIEEMTWPEAQPPRPGMILYEPDAAVIRANLAGVLARRYEHRPIDPRIALLIGDAVADTALATAFRVIDVQHWSSSKARSWLAAHDVGDLDIKTRGFAARPEDIRRHLRLRGKRKAVLFLTRLGREPTAILAERCT